MIRYVIRRSIGGVLVLLVTSFVTFFIFQVGPKIAHVSPALFYVGKIPPTEAGQKLLDVASAFALSPEIILLDEPTSGVSTADKSTIMRVLVQAARQMGIKAIIQIEHDMDIVFGYSNRIIAVHNGRILADGSPASIRARADVMATIVGRQYGDA